MPHTASPAAINPGIRFNIEVDLPYILLWLISDLNITLRFSGLDAGGWGRRQKIFAPWFLVRLRSGCLHSQGVVHLFPIDLAQQFLDTVFRAVPHMSAQASKCCDSSIFLVSLRASFY